MMEELAYEHVDTSEVEIHLEELKKKLRSHEIALDKLKNKRKNLDPLSDTYDNQCDYLDSLAPPLMEAIQSTEAAIVEVEAHLDALKAQILTRNDIYEGLTLFSQLYDEMSDYEKKKFLRMFIDHIELYPDKSRKYGCYIKSIDFLFPVSYHGEKVYSVKRQRPTGDNSSQSLSHVESIVTMTR
jgi:hypothetical protein